MRSTARQHRRAQVKLRSAAARRSPATTTRNQDDERRAHRLHHPSVVHAPRDGAVSPRVPGAARRDRRSPDRRRARPLPAPLHGTGRDARAGRARAQRRLHRRDRRRRAGERAALPRPGHRAQPALAGRREARGRRGRARGRPRDVRRVQDRVLRRAAARPPRGAASRDGLLPLQQHRRRHRARARAPRPVARRGDRLRRPPRQRHRGHLRGRSPGADGLHVPASALPVLRRPPGARTWSTCRSPKATAARSSAPP